MCEKSGGGNFIILFCFANIPTVCIGSSQTGLRFGVKKWDKRIGNGQDWVSLPRCAPGGVGFSKTRPRHKSIEWEEIGGLSTFQGTTVTATSISSF